MKGCGSMKLESVKKHELSRQHKDAEAAHRAHVQPDHAPMELAIQKMEKEEVEQMKSLFNTAFYLVAAERPFSDFPALLQLQRLNGLPLGKTYSNPKQARMFVHYIAEEMRQDLVCSLKDIDFFSVCMDSSTDSATIDEEMVQIRILQDNFPVYKFVAVKALPKADAAGIVAAVVSTLETECECHDWKDKLVGMSADGAAVNMGVRTGVAKRLQDEAPCLVAVHCCAHRIELAIKTISTEVNFFKSLEDTLVDLYRLYHKSPLCWSGLQQVGETLQIHVLKPVKLVGTRWIAHRQRALKILLDGWQGFVVHISQVAQGSTQSKDRAHRLYTTLTSLKFFLFSRACTEFLAVIQHFSKVMQYDSITIDGVLQKFAATKERLENMLSTMGTTISKEIQSLGENLTYAGEQLKVPRGYAGKESVVTAVTTLMKTLISGAISALEARFSSFQSNQVVVATRVFSPFTWPSDQSALCKFGYDEIRLLSTHFSHPLQQRGYVPEFCVDEWPELKLVVKEMISKEPSMKYLPMWQRILNEYKLQPALTNILALVRITLVIPVQTATLERGFSLMQRMKNDWRNRLRPNTLSQLMLIKLNGPAHLDSFDAQPAISAWWKAGPRSRRPTSKPYGPRTKPDSESETDSSSSESD